MSSGVGGGGGKSALPFPLTSYEEVQAVWPEVGNHILASYNKESLVLYVGCGEWVATAASGTQSFKGLIYHVNWTLRPAFLSAIYSTGWCTRANNEHLLALTVSREGIEKILQMSLAFKGVPNPQAKLTWEPDRSPFGDELDRNVPAISLRKDVLDRLLRDWVNNIKDVTNFVRLQRKYLLESKLNYILVPHERPLDLEQTLANKLGVDKPIPLVLPDYHPHTTTTTTQMKEEMGDILNNTTPSPSDGSDDDDDDDGVEDDFNLNLMSSCYYHEYGGHEVPPPYTTTELDYDPHYLCNSYHHYHHLPILNQTDTTEAEEEEETYSFHHHHHHQEYEYVPPQPKVGLMGQGVGGKNEEEEVVVVVLEEKVNEKSTNQEE